MSSGSLTVAEIVEAAQSLPIPLSTLLAVPIPEQYQAAGEDVQAAVEQAIGEMFAQGIDRSGKDVSPWLLKRVGELTGDVALDLSKPFMTDQGDRAPLNVRCEAHREQCPGRRSGC